MIKVGDRAPGFAGRDQHGREIALDDLIRRGPVVLYFYPKDFTRVCTKQACLFQDAYADLQGSGAELVGVSLDDDQSHDRFSTEHGLEFSLLADPERKISRAYDVLRLFGVITKRVTFVIDRRGIVRGVFHHELSAERHVADVREMLSSLASEA